LTKSTFEDLLKQCKGNKEAADALAKQMQADVQAENVARQNKKILELKNNFADLSDQEIRKVLDENQWDVDAAILPLFELTQKKKEKEEEDALQKRRREIKEREREKARTFLRDLFSEIDEKQIQKILDENEGDVDATTEQLLKLKADKEIDEEKEMKEKKEREKEIKLEALIHQFSDYILDKDIKEQLENHNYNIEAVTPVLLKITEERKVVHLRRLYKFIKVGEVKEELDKCNWNVSTAMNQLKILNTQRKEAQIKAEKEKKEREEEEKRRLEKNRKRKKGKTRKRR